MKKGPTSPKIPEIGTHFGKSDLERLGYFAELSYLHGKGYNKPIISADIRDPKNRQMLPEFPKWKTTGLQDCYFDKVFKRLYTGEAYFDSDRYYLRQRMENAKKNVGLFRPSSYTHLHATPGDFFGCFTKSIPAFDPRRRAFLKDVLDVKKKLLQFLPTDLPKKGGYGYLDITINPYPKYMSSPYYEKYVPPKTDPKSSKRANWIPPSKPGLFQTRYSADSVTYNRKVPAVWYLFGVFKPPNPTKSLGGCMQGCFDKWPTHSIDPYIDFWRIEKGKTTQVVATKEKERVWFPNGTGKSNQTGSVMERKIRICTNAKTWKNMTPVTYTREFI